MWCSFPFYLSFNNFITSLLLFHYDLSFFRRQSEQSAFFFFLKEQSFNKLNILYKKKELDITLLSINCLLTIKPLMKHKNQQIQL